MFNDHNPSAILLREIARRLAQTLPTRYIPLSVALWDIDDVAHYLNLQPRVVRERIATLRGFPKAILLPDGKKKPDPLYKAMEVINWAESHRRR